MRHRIHQIPSVSLLAGLALLGLSGGAALASSFDLADHVDAKARVYLTIDDLGASWSGFPDTPLGRTLADEEIRTFLTRLGAETSAGPAGLPIGLEHGYEGGLPGRVAFAMLGTPDGDRTAPSVVGSVSLGGGRDDLVTVLNVLLEQLRSVDPGSSRGRLSTIQGEIHRIAVLGLDVSYFWKDDTLVFGTRREELLKILRSLAEPREDSLAANPRFRELRTATGADAGGMFLYYGSDADGAGAAGSDRIVRALGLDGIDSVGLFSRLREDGRGVTRVRIRQAGEHRGWLDALGRREGEFVTTRYLSPEAVAGFSVKLESAGMTRLAARLTAALGLVPGTPLEARDDRGRPETPWPIALVRALGDEAGLYVAPRQYGPWPELGIVVLLRDPARAENALIRASKSGAGLRVRTYEIRGRRYFRLDQKATSSLLTSLTVADGVLAAGTDIRVIESMLARARADGEDSLAARPEFRKTVSVAPADASALLFVDTPRGIRWAYEAGRPFLMMGVNMSRQGKEGVEPLTLAEFPSGEALTRHLGPAVTWFAADDGGLTVESRSDVQNELTVFSFLIGIGFGLTTATRVESRPLEVRAPEGEWAPPPPPEARIKQIAKKRQEDWCRLCHTNLELFWRAWLRYRMDHEGRPPPNLGAFFGPGPARGPQFWSPADREARQARREGREPVPSYEYVGPDIPAKVEEPDGFALVWTRAPFHEGRRLVLFLSGRIRLVPEAEFRKVLEATRALVEK